MIVRQYTGRDLEQIVSIHQASGLDYEFPDQAKEVFAVRQVVEDENTAKVSMALFARRTLEAYMVHDHGWRTPKWRWEAFRVLHESACLQARGHGYTDVNLWLPPQLARSFGRRLMSLGWNKQLWPTYSRRLD